MKSLWKTDVGRDVQGRRKTETRCSWLQNQIQRQAGVEIKIVPARKIKRNQSMCLSYRAHSHAASTEYFVRTNSAASGVVPPCPPSLIQKTLGFERASAGFGWAKEEPCTEDRTTNGKGSQLEIRCTDRQAWIPVGSVGGMR